MPRRLILCFDGTWNTPESHTNVSRFYAEVADTHSGCREQLKFYDPGVGTQFGSMFTGGAAGKGLSRNILQGYAWLIRQYESANGATTADRGQTFDDGDQIFLFGFSRGAFTARSLAGLINRCGILKRDDPALKDGKALKSEDELIDTPLVREAWEIYRDRSKKRDSDAARGFRKSHSWNVKVRMVGVWDTVGALGIPETLPLPDTFRERYSFHDTSLGMAIDYAFHAVAIDEQREDYKVSLWSEKAHNDQVVEQRWFPGAHANVGGGYEDDLLPDPPLHWMARRAQDLGIVFIDPRAKLATGQPQSTTTLPPTFDLTGNEHLSPVRDSYKEFGLGLYGSYMRVTTTLAGKPRGRFYRPMLAGGIEETVDETANLKWSTDSTYRPKNLASAGRFLGPNG